MTPSSEIAFILGVPGEREREAENFFEVVAENFPNLRKKTYI